MSISGSTSALAQMEQIGSSDGLSASSSSTYGKWDDYKSKFVHLQRQIEHNLHEVSSMLAKAFPSNASYSYASSTDASSSKSAARVSLVASSISACEARVKDTLELLNTAHHLFSEINNMPNEFGIAQHAQIRRYRSVFENYIKEVESLQSTLEDSKSQIHRLERPERSVAWNDLKMDPKISDDRQLLLEEEAAAESSILMMDELLHQGAATRDALYSQNIRLTGTSNKLTNVSQIVPNVSHIATRISRVKAQHQLIIVTIVGLCTLLFLWKAF